MEKLVFQSVFFPEAAVKLRIPVFRISRKRMTDARHMNTDLMSPPGLQLAFHIGKAAKALQYADSM